ETVERLALGVLRFAEDRTGEATETQQRTGLHRLQLFDIGEAERPSGTGLDDIDACRQKSREYVLDGPCGHFSRRQDRVDLGVCDVAARFGALDYVPDGRVREIEQRQPQIWHRSIFRYIGEPALGREVEHLAAGHAAET